MHQTQLTGRFGTEYQVELVEPNVSGRYLGLCGSWESLCEEAQLPF